MVTAVGASSTQHTAISSAMNRSASQASRGLTLEQNREKFHGVDDLYFLLGEMEMEVHTATKRAEEAERRLQMAGRDRQHPGGQSPRKTAELLTRAVREADEARAHANEAHAARKKHQEEHEAEQHSHRRTWEDAAALRSRHNALKDQATMVSERHREVAERLSEEVVAHKETQQAAAVQAEAHSAAVQQLEQAQTENERREVELVLERSRHQTTKAEVSARDRIQLCISLYFCHCAVSLLLASLLLTPALIGVTGRRSTGICSNKSARRGKSA